MLEHPAIHRHLGCIEFGALAYSASVSTFKHAFWCRYVCITVGRILIPPVAIYHPERLKETVAVQSLSRVQLCYPVYCSMPGLPVHHQLPELAQTHAY